jgi:hypothetical protein
VEVAILYGSSVEIVTAEQSLAAMHSGSVLKLLVVGLEERANNEAKDLDEVLLGYLEAQESID